MQARGLTRARLAEKVGLGQPAMARMLHRARRPQRKAVARFAEALGVAHAEFWPAAAE